MRTSIDIPDSLLVRAKRVPRERKTTLRALVLDALREVLRAGPRGSPRYVMKDCSFGGEGLVNGLDWADPERLRDLTYEGRGA